MASRQPYPPEQSPLYNLRSRARLCSLLNVARSELEKLQSDDLYRVFLKGSDGKARTIEEPRGSLKRVHKRLHSLLARATHPEWCFSGIRGRSYIDNARRHVGKRYLLRCDIRGFYQSSRKEYVFRFFHNRMKQPEDIAWLLADIATFCNHLPTGSSSSPLLAFRSYESMFQALWEVAADAGAEFTLYVDDMTLSSKRPPQTGIVGTISQIVSSYGLELKRSKTRFYGPRCWKKVTGVALSPTGVATIPNRLRNEIHTLSKALRRKGIDPKALRRLFGLLCAAQQIDPTFGKSLKCYVREIMDSGVCE